MKVAITGSPNSSLNPNHKMNEWIFDYFNEYEVIQISRTTGYDFDDNYEEALQLIYDCDIFVNSACIKDVQLKFLKDTYGKVEKIINIGSIAGDFYLAQQAYNHDNYPLIKNKLKNMCKILPLKSGPHSKILHLNITEIEHDEVKGITYQQLSDCLDFWLANTYVQHIDIKPFADVDIKDEKKSNKIRKVLEVYDLEL